MPGSATPSIAHERRWLESMHRRYHDRRLVHPDPLEFLYAHDDVRDREIVGLVAACLAYGNVTAMLPAIARALETLGTEPAARLQRTAPRHVARRLDGFRYRFTTGEQLAGLLVGARRAASRQGSLEACVAAAPGGAGEATVVPGLARLVDAIQAAAPCPLGHLLPHPRGGSACKRLHLFLRWMVRRDAVDPGGWTHVEPRQLVVPLDTHVHRTALARGWTRRRTPNGSAASEITDLLREVRPEDPLRYDFAITRPGIRGERPRTPEGTVTSR